MYRVCTNDWVMCDFLINSVVVCILGGVVEGSGMYGLWWGSGWIDRLPSEFLFFESQYRRCGRV